MPDWQTYVRRRLALSDLDPGHERRIVRELAANLEDAYLEGLAAGMSPDEAEAHAALQIQDWDSFAREVRFASKANVRSRLDRWSERSQDAAAVKEGKSNMFAHIQWDLVQSLRRLRMTPGFTLAALFILALGIGANTAMFSVIDTFLFRPLPFVRSAELVRIYEDDDNGAPGTNSFPAYRDLAEQSDVFTSAAAFIMGQPTSWLPDTGIPMQATVSWVGSGYFPTAGLRPFLGRNFDRAMDQAGASPAGVVSYRTWRAHFAGDPSTIGRAVKISGVPVTIVGIGPRGYDGIVAGNAVDFWLSLSSLGPIAGAYAGGTMERRDDHWFDVLARLRPGVSREQAQAAVSLLAARLGREYPEYHKGRKMTVFRASDVRLEPNMDRDLYPAGAAMMALAALVLLVACSNMAALLLARGSRRGHELAVRLAIGASRWRLVRLLLVESVLVGVGGGLLGLLVARGSLSLLIAQKAALALPINPTVELDARAVAFTFCLSLLTGVTFGLVPALRVTRPNLIESIKDPESAAAGAVTKRARLGLSLKNLFVVAQVAGSMVLLVAAGLLVRGLVAARHVDLGFPAPDRVAILLADAGQAGYDGTRATTAFREFAERLRQRPGVDSVSWATRVPLTQGPSSTLVIDEYQARTGAPTAEVENAYVGPGYFQTLKLPLLYGRDFSETDFAGTSRIAVVSEGMARRYWGKPDVVGLRYRHQGSQDSWVEIIGVVGDIKAESLGEEGTPVFYRPLRPGDATRLFLVARSGGNPQPAAAMMQQLFRELNPAVPVIESGTMASHAALSLGLHRAAAGVVGILGLVSLLLAGIGLYGVVAFAVTQRTAEVGIRMALGARAGQVVAMLIREEMALVAAGIAAGLLAALWAGPLIRGLLFGIRPGDPLTLAFVAALLAAVSLLATWLPARHAVRIGPVDALRYR